MSNDLSLNSKDAKFWDDLVFTLQNMLGAENHCLVSYSVNKNNDFLEIAKMIRRKRSNLMYKFIKESKEQLYCLSKHLLASAMGLKEISNRFITTGEEDFAKECIDEANLYEKLVIEINEVKNAKV